MTAVAAEAAVVVDNGRETSGETSLWHGAAAGAAARVDPLLRRVRGLTRFDRVSCGRRGEAAGSLVVRLAWAIRRKRKLLNPYLLSK